MSDCALRYWIIVIVSVIYLICYDGTRRNRSIKIEKAASTMENIRA